MGGRMGLFEFLFGIFLVTTVLGLGILGLSIWGISKGVRAIARRLSGHTQQEQRRMEAPPRPPSGVKSPFAAEERAERPKRSTRVGQPSSRARDYEYMDVEKGATPEHILQVMRDYVDDYVTGEYAQSVIDTLDTEEFRRKSLFSEIDNRFSRNSISWDRFASTAQEALDAVVRNCALLANRVQAFDATDYARMEQFYASGGFATNESPDPSRLQRWRILDETKREMDGIRTTNEKLLLELEKLSSELGKLTSVDYRDEDDRISEEIGRLVEETKYYR
jgi:hypothetical protein